MKRKNGKIAIELEPNKSVLRPARPTARPNVRCYCIIFMFHGTVVGVEISACCQNGSGTVDYRLTSSQDRPFGRISLSGKPRLPSPTDFNSLVAALVEHRDRAAFAQLFDYFVPRFQSHLIRLGTDSAQAEEITQDAHGCSALPAIAGLTACAATASILSIRPTASTISLPTRPTPMQ